MQQQIARDDDKNSNAVNYLLTIISFIHSFTL